MTGERARLVTRQGRETHVSSVVLSPEEAADMLEHEAELHEQTGWDVDRFVDGTGTLIGVLASNGPVRRSISVKTFTPWDDKPEGGTQ